MIRFIFFMIGLMVGGIAGVFTMCLLQINRLNEEKQKEVAYDEDKKHSKDCQA